MNQFRLLPFFLLISVMAAAQNFGGNPPKQWAQVNTEAVRVIFPKGLDSVANRVASVASVLQKRSQPNYRFRKINLVLQPNTTVSNAFVTLAPYYSEFYLTAPQNAFELGSLSWADNLVIHEWRHVQQYNYFNRGLAKFSSVILGQEGRALLNSMAIPDWFFEGDAVWNETKYSQQGRGRLPLAFSGYKSLFLQGKHYSYMKLRNRSLKDYVPNHYDLGYLLVAYGAEKYGKDFWDKVTADASAFKPLFYPMQGAIRKYAGVPFKQFVGDAMNYYQQQWKQEQVWTDTATLSNLGSYRQDFLYPYTATNGDLVVVKETSKQLPTFYRLKPDGTPVRIGLQGITNDKYFSYRNERIVFAGYGVSARWANKEYSNVYLIDLASGKRTKLTHRTRYFSPDISNDGASIVAVEMKTNGSSRLVWLDQQGKITNSVDAPKGEIFSQPKFSSDDKTVFVPVRNAAGAMCIRQYGEGSKVTTVVPFGHYILGNPTVQGDTILFTATNGKSDDIYAVIASSGTLYHLASSPMGLYQATLRNGTLVCAAFTAEGYRLYQGVPKWQQVTSAAGIQNLYVQKALTSDLTVEQIPTERFSNRKYHTLSHPFNFHSWRPYYDQPEFSFTLYGQNVLNTVATELSYIYNQNENTHAAAGSLIYGGTVVQPYINARHTWQRSFAYRPDTVATWNELEYGAGLQLPLNLSGDRMYRSMNFAASYQSLDVNLTGKFKSLFRANNIHYLLFRWSFVSRLPTTPQQIYPHFGISAATSLRTALNVTAKQFAANGNIYLPGFLRTHSTVVSLAYQGRDTMGEYNYTNNFPYPRGFDGGYNLPRMWRVGLNYHFPLFHPDWGVANIIYFMRMRANAFTDYAQLQSLRTKNVYAFHTAGGELYFDTKVWNQLPVSFGIRYNYLVNQDVPGINFNQWEFIVPIGLIN